MCSANKISSISYFIKLILMINMHIFLAHGFLLYNNPLQNFIWIYFILMCVLFKFFYNSLPAHHMYETVLVF